MTAWILVAIIVAATTLSDVAAKPGDEKTRRDPGFPAGQPGPRVSYGFSADLCCRSPSLVDGDLVSSLSEAAVRGRPDAFAVPATAASYVIETFLAQFVLKERVGPARWTGALAGRLRRRPARDAIRPLRDLPGRDCFGALAAIYQIAALIAALRRRDGAARRVRSTRIDPEARARSGSSLSRSDPIPRRAGLSRIRDPFRSERPDGSGHSWKSKRLARKFPERGVRIVTRRMAPNGKVGVLRELAEAARGRPG